MPRAITPSTIRDITFVRQRWRPNQNAATDDCRQQITEVESVQVGFGTVTFTQRWQKAKLTTVINAPTTLSANAIAQP